MKNYSNYLFILLLLSLGCREESVSNVGECVGATFYYLDNQSNRSLFIEFVGPVLNNQIDTATVINMQQRVLIGQDAIFGSIPRPTDTFSSFALFTLVGGKKNIVYKQDPVQTALWTKRKHSATDPDFGCQEVDYTLTITDTLLK